MLMMFMLMMVMTMLMMTTAMTVCTRRGDMWPAALKATPGAFRLCKKQREPETTIQANLKSRQNP